MSISLINGLVFDSLSGEVAEHPVHIEGRSIAALDGPPPDGARVMDVRNRLVIPGLIDAHFHATGVSLNLMELESLPSSYVTAKAALRLHATLRRGFTTVRDPAGGDIGLQMALREGLLSGPRYLFAGPALSQTGGHGDPRSAHLGAEALGSRSSEVVDGIDALRRAVRARFRGGSHAIKVFASGGVMSPSDPLMPSQYSADEIRAVSDEASRRGSYVMAHAYSAEAIRHAVSNGVRTVEHGNFLDDGTAQLMAEEGAFLVPTLVTYDAMIRRGAELGLAQSSLEKNTKVFEAGATSIEIARAAGVSIGFGTDLIASLEEDQLLEFQLRSEVDDVADLIKSATSVNAEVIGRNDLGSIKPGATADLVVLSGNPFDDASVLWDLDRDVIQNGRLVPN